MTIVFHQYLSPVMANIHGILYGLMNNIETNFILWVYSWPCKFNRVFNKVPLAFLNVLIMNTEHGFKTSNVSQYSLLNIQAASYRTEKSIVNEMINRTNRLWKICRLYNMKYINVILSLGNKIHEPIHQWKRESMQLWQRIQKTKTLFKDIQEYIKKKKIQLSWEIKTI